jgi:hypothetical protein
VKTQDSEAGNAKSNEERLTTWLRSTYGEMGDALSDHHAQAEVPGERVKIPVVVQ